MKYRGNSCGSALLIVFSVFFILSLITLRFWNIVGLFVDIQSQREQYYKNFYDTDKFLDIGINLVCKKFNKFLKSKLLTANIDLSFALARKEFNKGKRVLFQVSKWLKKSNCLILSVSLIRKNNVLCNLRCILERRIKIQKNKNEAFFVINYFTLGSIL